MPCANGSSPSGHTDVALLLLTSLSQSVDMTDIDRCGHVIEQSVSVADIDRWMPCH